MNPNVNPETGVRYGIIAARTLNSDLVCELQDKGTEPHYEEAWKDHLANALAEATDEVGELDDTFDEDQVRQEFNDDWQPDEPVHEGELDGVKYRTTWVGGALCVWVFFSPHITKARLCSPCVPNCGDLDSLDAENGVECYDVPPTWRDKQ